MKLLCRIFGHRWIVIDLGYDHERGPISMFGAGTRRTVTVCGRCKEINPL